MITITIPSNTDEAMKILVRIMSEIEVIGNYDQRQKFGIRLSIEEALMNAIKHGNQNDESKTVTISYEVTNIQTSITIQDQGQGFDPEKIPDPTTPENIEKDSGRGVMLIKHYAEKIEFSDNGRCVYMQFGTTPKGGNEQDKRKQSKDGKFETKCSSEGNTTTNVSTTCHYRYAA